MTTLLAGSFTAMASLVADQRVPTAGVQMKAHNVMEGFLEVLGRCGVVMGELRGEKSNAVYRLI